MNQICRFPAPGPRLAGVLEQRQADVDKAKAKKSIGSLTGAIGEAAQTAGFRAALFHHYATTGRPGVIADIQGASPLSMTVRSRLDVRELAIDFHDAGAVCVSACQDRRLYRGSLADFTAAKTAGLPILANDLVNDVYQIIEARYAGADAALLIVGVLGDRLPEYLARADSVKLDCLVEVHGEDELAFALECGANLVAVNNRDLETMEVDPTVCERLLPLIPHERVLAVASGGISSFDDIAKMGSLGAKAVRVGAALMAAPDPYVKLHELLGTTPDDLVDV